LNKTQKDDWLLSEDENQTGDDDFARKTFFDKTMNFGFSSDNDLGKLAEANKAQMHQAMGNLNLFGRTEYAAKN